MAFTERPSAAELEACTNEVFNNVIEQINASRQLGEYDFYMNPFRGEYHYKKAYDALPGEKKALFSLDDNNYPTIENALDFHEVEKVLANDRSDLELSDADLDFARTDDLALG